MYRPRVKVLVYKNVDYNSWSSKSTEFKGVFDINTRKGIKAVKDYFNFKVQNRKQNSGDYKYREGLKEDFDKDIKLNDSVEIYGWDDDGSSVFPYNQDNLLFTGIVNDFDYDSSSTGLSYTIKGVNRTEELLNTYVPATYSMAGSINTPPKFVKELIRRANVFNPGKKLFAFYDSEDNPLTGSKGLIQTTTVGGNSFETVEFREDWKSVYLMFEKIATQVYTNPLGTEEDRGVYIINVKTRLVVDEWRGKPYQGVKIGSFINEIEFKSKSNTTVGSIIEGDTISKINIKKGVFNVVNYLIVNAGTDMEGDGIRTWAMNVTSANKLGVKSDIYNSNRRFSDLKNNEIVIGSQYSGSTFTIEGYPDDIVTGGSTWSFNHEANFSYSVQTYNAQGSPTGYASATDKRTYNNVLREESRRIAKNEAQQVVDNLGEARYRVKSTNNNFDNSLVEGDLFEVQAKTYGWLGTSDDPTYKIRLESISHKLSNNGWETTYDFVEDEKKFSENLNG